jgi:hypothetical protein
MGSHPPQPDTSRMTSRSAKMIFTPYKIVAHPRSMALPATPWQT